MAPHKFAHDPAVSDELRQISQRISGKASVDTYGILDGMKKDSNENLTNKLTLRPVSEQAGEKPYKMEILWFPNVFAFAVMHLAALYGLYRAFTGQMSIHTAAWGMFIGMLSAEGVTVGAHRMYTHRGFKATLPLRILIVIFQTIATQNSIWEWVRDHRLHHKYADTDADPHNASRGFFFSHIGWLMVRKHPASVAAGRKLDLSDIEADKLVMFQKRNYKYLYLLLGVIIPIGVPVYFWGETWTNAILFAYFHRVVFMLNVTWMINSAAHMYGTRPFDKDTKATDHWFASMFSHGEGWHNYHHTFPWDYRASEYGQGLNWTAQFIDMFAAIGWAYDLRAAPSYMVWKRALRTGDSTHLAAKESFNGNPVEMEKICDESLQSKHQQSGGFDFVSFFLTNMVISVFSALYLCRWLIQTMSA